MSNSKSGINIYGTGSKIPLFVHEFGDDSTAFSNLVETQLAEYFRLVFFDLPGFGSNTTGNLVLPPAQYGAYLTKLARELFSGCQIGVVAHSVGSIIAIDAIRWLGDCFSGLFSIEGNLTRYDLFLTSKVAARSDPEQSKIAFLRELSEMHKDNPVTGRYMQAVMKADAYSLWHLAKYVVRSSEGDNPGLSLLALEHPYLFYWNPENTSTETARWISENRIANRKFYGASHWPMVDDTTQTASVIAKFYHSATKRLT
ncbi:pimeloyl-ACP methyl ester carboxylesterase [Bradyrhizobium sp. S3.2.6]|uniref:alpha/beta fold hydrolase n=1 Tax=Bradyrhizobium sp. S3.2.6 TaxID=3156428 RepID=UPI00339B65AD